jgi:type I restriction enzyme S subunit
MKSEFLEFTLNDLCILIADCPHATPKWTSNGFIVLRNQNIKNGRLDLSEPSYTDEDHYLGRIRRANPQPGDLVITREAPMGDVCLIPKDLKCCLGQRQVLLRPNPNKIVSRFLLYALQSPYLQHQIGWNEGTGSTVSNLRIPVLEALKVPTPSLYVQQKIAEMLGTIDDRISLLRDTNQTLEAIAQAIFKSWFVDFDPVSAKSQGLEPDGMDAETAALFPDAFEETELGLVPRGWTFQAVGELLVPKRGKSITKTKCVDGGIPVVAGGLEPAYFHNQSNVHSPVVTISASGANAGFIRLYQQDIWASDEPVNYSV